MKTIVKEKKFSMDMCNGPILKKMLLFGLPLMISNLLQLLFNAADIIVVGRFAGVSSLAAVGATSSLVSLIVNLFTGISVGVNILVSNYYGSKRMQDLTAVIHTGMAFALVGGVVFSVVGIISAPYLLKLMQTPEEVIDLATVYIRAYFGGLTAIAVYNFGAAILRAVGDTKRPFLFLTFAGIVNVILNLFFVILLKWGVLGVGLATTISQILSALLVMRCLMKEKTEIRVCLKNIWMQKAALKKILQIGLPAGFQGILFSISNVLIQSYINLFGETVVAGNSAGVNIEGFVYVTVNTFYYVTISFVSQNYGAKKYQRIGRIVNVALLCVLFFGIIFGGLSVLCGENLLSLYTNDFQVIQSGMLRMKMVCGFLVFCGFMDVMNATLRGLGYAVLPTVFTLVGIGLRMLYIIVMFQIEQFRTVETIYISFATTWLLTAIGLAFAYRAKKRLLLKGI